MNKEEKTNKPMFKEFPEIKTTSLVSKEELKDIIDRYQNGDKEAEQQLKDANMRFVASVVRRYLDKGLSKEELIAAGTEGLLIAAKEYDPNGKFKFIAYAVWYIRKSILERVKEAL